MDRFKKKTDENGERTSLKIKISMRKTAKMIAVVSCTILMLAACSPKKEVISQSVTGNEDKTYDSGEWIVQKNGSLIQNAGGNQDGEKKRYCFQDVEENRYEAPLLSDVPKCTYDFSDLKTDEQTGYKSYQDPETGAKAKLGIDVSEFQGEVIDWKQVKESGVEFVMVRLGYRAYGESGSLVLDAMYEQNVKNALEAGLQVSFLFTVSTYCCSMHCNKLSILSYLAVLPKEVSAEKNRPIKIPPAIATAISNGTQTKRAFSLFIFNRIV